VADPLETALLARMTVLEDLTLVFDMGLTPACFETQIHQAMFATCLNFWQASARKYAPSLEVLRTEYPQNFDTLPHPDAVDNPAWWLAEKIMNRYAANQVDRIMLDVATRVQEDPQASLMELGNRSLAAANNLVRRDERSDMLDFQARRERYVDRFNNAEPGMTLGIPELDDWTGGVRPGEICAVAGFTKTGKSWFLFNAAVAARRAGYTPLVMSLELGMRDSEDRIDALFSGVSYSRLRNARLRTNEMDQLVAAQEQLAQLGPIYIEKPPRGQRTVAFMASRLRQLEADYLIIDQLSWIDATREYRGDSAQRQKTGDLIFDLRDEIHSSSAGMIPTMLAVQHNRAAAIGSGRGGGARGQLQNFANSSMIEQTVDLALGLYRSDEQRVNGLMGCDIMGARRCDKADFLLRWELDDETAISFQDRVADQLTTTGTS
jgi:hypothetical protein